jgi:hypothetical protein
VTIATIITTTANSDKPAYELAAEGDGVGVDEIVILPVDIKFVGDALHEVTEEALGHPAELEDWDFKVMTLPFNAT